MNQSRPHGIPTPPSARTTASRSAPNRADLADSVSIDHLVALLEVVDGCGLSKEAHRLAAEAIERLVFSAPVGRPLYERLQTLARDAGYGTDRLGLLNGYTTYRELEALLTHTTWIDPADVLDPTGEIGLDLPSLKSATRARVQRGEGDTRTLLSVLDRLTHACPCARSHRPDPPNANTVAPATPFVPHAGQNA